MNFRKPLFMFSLLFAMQEGYAQKSSDTLGSGINSEFYAFVEESFSAGPDTADVNIENAQYELMFTATCSFTEVIMPSKEGEFIPFTSSSGASIFVPPPKEQDNVPFLGETLQEQRASFYGCAENIQLSTDTALWEFEQKVFEQITYYIMISGISPLSTFGSYAIKSFGKGEYVLAETSGIYSVGSQTSYRSTVTMYFRRLEEQ